MINEQERFEIYMQMKKKKIRQNALSKHLGCSNAWISYFFSNKVNISESHYQQLVEYIEAH